MDMLKTIIASFDSSLQKLLRRMFVVYFESGNKGYLKFIISIILIWYVFNAIRKCYGLQRQKSIKNNHIVITGAGMGLGRGISFILGQKGANLSLIDLNEQALNETIGLCQQKGIKAKGYICDITDHKKIQQIMQKMQEQYGTVDILINNAGIVSGRKILANSPELMKKTIEVNCTSHHYTVKAVLQGMINKGSGQIVSIASCAGLVGVCGLVDYCASKFGAVGFNESLRMELKENDYNIKTTCICPYYINTGMFDGVYTPFYLPILDERWACNRIVWAILQQQQVVIMPWILNLGQVVRAVVPVGMFDYFMKVVGANKSMDNFRGR